MPGRRSRDDAAFFAEGKMLRELEATVPPSECAWSVDADGVWRARCKGYAEFRFVNGLGPRDNGFVFCPYCGDRLRQLDAEPSGKGGAEGEGRPHHDGH